jgi:hypothetical protein
MARSPAAKPTTAAKPAAKPRAKKPLDLERLERLAQLIEDEATKPLVPLLHRLETEEGLKLVESTGTYVATLAGVKASGTAGPRMALANWANAARRAVRAGRA